MINRWLLYSYTENF